MRRGKQLQTSKHTPSHGAVTTAVPLALRPRENDKRQSNRTRHSHAREGVQ